MFYLKNNKDKLGLSSILLLICGISSSVVFAGPDSIYYYAIIVISLILSIPFYFKHDNINKKITTKIFYIALLPILYYFLHLLFAYKYMFAEPQVIKYYIAMSLVIYFCCISALLKEDNYKFLMIIVSIFHAFLCIYGLLSGGFDIVADEGERFTTDNVREILFSEFALGVYVASILSKRLPLIFLSIIFNIFIFNTTQVRGVILAVLISFYIFGLLYFKKRRIIYFLITTSFLVLLVINYLDVIGTLFLINDEHRGASSGFSGRFENWDDGINIFLGNPFFGIGLADPIAAFVHNIFIKIPAQFGLFFTLLFYYVVIKSFLISFNNKNIYIFVALVAWFIFNVTSPRTINFQIMPFIALSAMAVMIIKNNKINYL